MVKHQITYTSKQTGFTVVELIITIAIVAILIMMVSPTISSSIAEHRILNLIAALQTDLEWARNQALSTNQSVTVSFADATACKWTTSGNSVTTAAAASHKMDDTNLATNYNGVVCAFTGTSPVFNGLGLNNSGSFTATISSTATTKQWLLTLQGSGDLTVTAQ